MPQEIYSIWSKWPYIFGNVFCVIRGLAAETSTNASVMTITLFTIERYLAICHPFVSHKMSKLSRAIKHVLLLWVASLALALPQALQFGIKVHRGVTMCLQTRVILEHSFEISTFFFFFAPMILITVLYSLIGLRLYKTNLGKQNVEGRQLQRHTIKAQSIHRKNSTQSTKRVVKMLGNSMKKDKSSSMTKITYRKEENPIDSATIRNWKICEKCRRTVTTTIISYNHMNCDHPANILQDTRIAIDTT
ncbi:unnamed protein product [Danaus chrysippus]|uniref:(African queen) hypothetical protein n=1 Tax=Danaus chrysippus TaxID=151541 RepID=A0A8J2W9D0_9NEOP|nr:unnamed protein product [Danaus chrysippus]